MATTDHRKQSLYFPEEMLLEIQREALRQDRSLSWIVQQAWKLARIDIRRMPSVTDVLGQGPQPAQTQAPSPSSPPPQAPAPQQAQPQTQERPATTGPTGMPGILTTGMPKP